MKVKDTSLSKAEKRKLLKLLTYEKVKGKPVYYRGYEKVLKGEVLTPLDKYTKKLPLVVIEIDTKTDLSRYGSFEEYIYEKTNDLLNAGVQRVIWFITKVRKVLIAEKGKDWITTDWNKEIEVIQGVKLNLEKFLKDEGIKL